jgi:hypothetical protein
LVGASTAWPTGNLYPYSMANLALGSPSIGADASAVTQATAGAQ